jgi:hemerythrin
MRIRWDASLETGHPLVDAEHRMLVFLFHKLDAALKTGETQMAVNQVIAETKRFVEFHFLSEENLMRETHYPHLLAHQAEHMDLVKQMGVLASTVVARRKLPRDVLVFLSKWLLEHIATHDQSVALHVRDSVARPIGESAYGEYMNISPRP